jgi:catechol 2,3-dioxygenase-like lactoylglutathione lyase family enzyme
MTSLPVDISVVGISHVAVVTGDLDRFVDFYRDVFGLPLVAELHDDGGRHSLLGLGPQSFLHAFERPGSAHGRGSSSLFERGHIDHLALAAGDAATFEALRQDLVLRGVSDGEVTEFGIGRSVYFEDPDGMGCEVVLLDVDLTPEAVNQAVLTRTG